MSKQFTSPRSGEITVAVDADFLHLQVIADRAVTVARAEVQGPAKVVDDVRAEMNGGTWTLTFPRTARGAGNVTVINTGYGSSVITGGTFRGRVMQVGGRVIVNGVDVTDMAAAGAPEALRAVVMVPLRSSLTARVGDGVVATRGPMAYVNAETTSADVLVDVAEGVRARTVSGDIGAGPLTGAAMVRTVSGDIATTGAGPVEAETVSGDIGVHVSRAVAVYANSVSGDVRVTAGSGVRPDVRARSISGRVRTC